MAKLNVNGRVRDVQPGELRQMLFGQLVFFPAIDIFLQAEIAARPGAPCVLQRNAVAAAVHRHTTAATSMISKNNTTATSLAAGAPTTLGGHRSDL